MILLKSKEEIAEMRKAGLLVWQTHQVAAELVKPGVTTAEINEAVEKFIADNHALPLFKGVPGKVPFPAATCISVNDEIVHGIPGSRKLQEGDIVSIDIGCKLNGWCGDAAVTHPVGKISVEAQHLLDVTEGALRLAISLISKRRLWSEVAREMERYVERANCSVVKGLSGHGIGRSMHEDPSVPNYVPDRRERITDFQLKPGLVIAIEPMVNLGTEEMKTLPDYWTIATEDGFPSAHFEHTIAITEHGPEILTAGPDGKAWAV